MSAAVNGKLGSTTQVRLGALLHKPVLVLQLLPLFSSRGTAPLIPEQSICSQNASSQVFQLATAV